MKKVLVLAVVLVFAFASMAMAAGTSTITVQAVVDPACSVSGNFTIDFGNLDPVAAPVVNVAIVGPPTVSCNGATVTVVNTFAGPMTGPGAATIAYTPGTIIADATVVATGVPVDLITGTATIAAGAYTGADAGAYSDTFTIDITP
ncbi:hypothetical protein LCGC14_2135600 [marine sediment metagenome]|uniref:DUF4402 domain-containing protein n=1 Tax=marine sediment metagenome TaxID=412755 RepID=A0A0F9EMB0_9ZZZZ